MRQFWRVRSAATVSGVLLAALTLLGCGSSGTTTATTMNHAAPSSLVEVTLVPPAPSTTEGADGNRDGSGGDEDDPTEAILEAHRGFWDTWLAANDPPDPDHPGLRRYYTGAAYERAVAAIEKNRAEGRVIRPSEQGLSAHTTIIKSVGDGVAYLSDCEVDDSIVIDIATGEALNDRVVTNLYDVTLLFVTDGWKVQRNTRMHQWEGVTQCVDLP